MQQSSYSGSHSTTPINAFRRDVIQACEMSIWFVRMRVHTLKVLHTFNHTYTLILIITNAVLLHHNSLTP